MLKTFRKTKLVCTIGPASRSPWMVERLVRAGMSVARLNFSYGTLDEHTEVINTIRDVSASLHVHTAILIDLPGTKLRTGKLRSQQVCLRAGNIFSLVKEIRPGDEHRVSVNLPIVFRDIQPGHTIFLNDGAIQLKVKSATGTEVRCGVVVGGILTENRGINVPDVTLNIPSLTARDFRYIDFGVKQGIDFFAASFVRSAQDIVRIKRYLKRRRAAVPVIAKIEKHEAVASADSIIEAADGIMVARGDLGVEIPLAEVPVVQKRIVNKCNRAGKPVVVATQMLESMMNATRPTRAEVSDVANAIFDGADAVMLSGETAKGRYPVQAVKMMANIVAETEKALPYESLLLEKSQQVCAETDDAISYAACHMSHQLGATCIVAYTASGSTALRVSKYRPGVPILALTPSEAVARKLALTWGVESHHTPVTTDVDLMFPGAARAALQSGMAKRGDIVVITGGIPMGVAGRTNMVKVQRVE